MFHPRPAHWFDLMVPQDSVGMALETLAASRAVELEAHSAAPPTHDELLALRDGLEGFATQARRYRSYWPEPDRRTPFPNRPPALALMAARAQVDAWSTDAEPWIERLQTAERLAVDLTHLAKLLASTGDAFPEALLAPRTGTLFDAHVYLLNDLQGPVSVPDGAFAERHVAEEGEYLIAVGERDALARLGTELAASKARRIELPEGLNVPRFELAEELARRLDDQRRQADTASDELSALAERHGLGRALADLERLGWLAEHAGPTDSTRHFARVTGWCAADQAMLETALDTAGIAYVMSFGEAPPGKTAPMLLDNPAWARPFEMFVRMLGMPGQGETDPSPLLALIAPLLFGFMFGDVGQGAVLLMAGLILRRKLPAAAILVPGGLFAIAFGFAFGSVFAREDLIGALWLHPLATPIPVLGTALGVGVAVLLTGLALNGAGAHWQGQGRMWWRTFAGLIVAYVGVLLSFADTAALLLTAAGAVWFVTGSAFNARPGEGASAFGHALGEMVETLLQLTINTLSFVRVGAFAIAHAGLSSAIVVLADIAGPGAGFWVVMLAGNIFIIALEGLVAGIQTTRLMLFEFFIRFLRAEGRVLLALPTPAAWSMLTQGRTS